MYKLHKKEQDKAWVINTVSHELTQLKLVKSHPELGNFYAFNTIFSMPYQRKLTFDLIQQYNTLGIEKDELLKEFKEIMSLIETREAGYDSKIYHKIGTLERTLKDFYDFRETSLLICSLCIVPEADLELIGVFDQEKSKAYIKEWAKDPDLLAFFLTITQKLLNNITNKLDFNTLPSLTNLVQSQENLTSGKEENILKRTLKKLKSFF